MFEEDQGSKRLNQPFRTPGGPKKFAVYVKNDKGNVVKVNFGDSTGLTIKRDQPERRKAFRARHNCADPGPKTKARYWSCQMWRGDKSVSQQLNDAVEEVTIDGELIEEMGPNEREVAKKAGKILAHDFKAWAKDRYKDQRPTFKQYLNDISKSPTWRTDWFDKFMGAVEKSFDKHIKEDINFTPRQVKSKLNAYDVAANMEKRSERRGSKAPTLGAGFFSSVFDQPHSDVQHALKVGSTDNIDGDGYLNYLQRVVDLHNPYFPQISELSVFEGPHGAGYKVRLEYLDPMGDLKYPELQHIVKRMFGGRVDIRTSSDLVKWIETAVEEGATIDHVEDPALKQALQVMHEMVKAGFFNDIKTSNIMIRRTKFGPQLVFTDPFSE